MVKRVSFLLLALFVTTVCCGCWDSKDINNKILLITALNDYRGGLYWFYSEIPNISVEQSSQDTEGGMKKYSYVSGGGATFSEARKSLDSVMEDPVYLGTVRALVLTNAFVKKGIEMYMMRLQADVFYRKTLKIVTTFEKPEDLLSVRPSNNEAVGQAIDDLIDAEEATHSIIAYSVSDMLEFIYGDTSFVMPNIDIREDNLAFTGYSIINNDCIYAGFIPAEESNGLLILNGKNTELIYVIPFGEDNAARVKAALKKRTITPKYDNGRLALDMEFEFDSETTYLREITAFDEALQEEVRRTLESMIYEDIWDTIKKSKSMKCDYLQLKEPFRIKYPNEFEKTDWIQTYLDSDVTISIKSTMKMGALMDLEAKGDENE